MQGWRETAGELGLQLQDSPWPSFVGLSDRACHELLRTCLDEDQLQALLHGCRTRHDAHVEADLPLKPGLHELLAFQRLSNCL